MPTYVYACTSCGERTEAKQSFDDLPLEVCPHCGGKLRKMFSPVGIVFKGSGFYSTDTKKDAAAKSTKTEGDSSGGGEKKDSSKPSSGESKSTTEKSA